MNVGMHPGDLLVDRNLAGYAGSFAPENTDKQCGHNGACGAAEVEGRSIHFLNLAGTEIDISFGQVDVLWQLDKRTLEIMATDPSTPIALLERLASHTLADVRAAVADNRNTPIYTLWLLSKDTDADVRYQVAENHNLPLVLIRSLTDDENPYVACRAQQTYNRLQAS
jgi:hypothetical protein